MPIPIPVPTPDPTPPPPQVEVSHFFLTDRQPWARDLLVKQHEEALYRYGEYAMFVLMWTPEDFAAGLVDRCSVCYRSSDRIAEAYKQPVRNDCPNCFGTSFEGGYRAKIVRPSLWSDDNPENGQTPHGWVETESLTLETVNDFTWRAGDYVFRSDGERYRTAAAGDTTYLRTGFGQPDDAGDAVTLNAARVQRESDTSVVYEIPPDIGVLRSVLTVPVGRNTPVDFGLYEEIRGSLLA